MKRNMNFQKQINLFLEGNIVSYRGTKWVDVLSLRYLKEYYNGIIFFLASRNGKIRKIESRSRIASGV